MAVQGVGKVTQHQDVPLNDLVGEVTHGDGAHALQILGQQGAAALQRQQAGRGLAAALHTRGRLLHLAHLLAGMQPGRMHGLVHLAPGQQAGATAHGPLPVQAISQVFKLSIRVLQRCLPAQLIGRAVLVVAAAGDVIRRL